MLVFYINTLPLKISNAENKRDLREKKKQVVKEL